MIDEMGDYWTIQAMIKFGGSFVENLGRAAQHADPKNLEKIKKTWPKYWKHYEREGRSLELKEAAIQTDK